MYHIEPVIAWRYLRSRRKEGFISLITWLSFIGIALGVATLIVVMAVMNGFRSELVGRILGINAHISIAHHETFAGYDDDLQNILKIEGVQTASPVVLGQVLATANDAHIGAVINGMRAEDFAERELLNSNLIDGKMLSNDDQEGIIIGKRMALSMGLKIGDQLRLISPQTNHTFIGSMPRLKDFTVRGIFEVGMFEYDSSFIFMPLSMAQIYFQKGEEISKIEVMTDNPETVEIYAEKIADILGEDHFISSWKEHNAHFFNSLKVERNVMFLILTLIILVAALNIISGMFMLVSSKGKEVAIMRTIGVGRSSILRIFIFAGSVIGITGTLLGLALGVGFAKNVEAIRQFLEGLTNTELFAAEIYFLSQLPAEIQVEDVIIIASMALLVSVLATIYPAWRASRIQPVDGLRYE